ncbi:DUF5677 domain-containing protein [Xanthomonas sp. BRIP62418]|uniref:DUF5677 domain-containing protein n=1 Tax=Xanthomonas sp. BRIP62418 TaxID=2182391 RepID=UPI000F8C6B77|nr:DUF5677 domain-containing protein [Xanthomonas sp. BRIP62418]
MGKKKKGKRRNNLNSNRSTLLQHKRVGKTLLPPMIHMLPQEKLRFSSWLNNHLPEFLWAALAANLIPRKDLLQIFLRIAIDLGAASRNKAFDTANLTHSALGVSNDGIEQICAVIKLHPAGIKSLRPLLVLQSLPARERWLSELQQESVEDDVGVLAEAISKCLDHQSQQSTDIRWLVLIFKIFKGQAQFPETMAERLRKYMEIEPEDEEMRFIRPSIRAAEMAFRMMTQDGEDVESQWCRSFWQESLEKSQCIPDRRTAEVPEVDLQSLQASWFEKQYELVERFLRLQSTTGLDAKIDAVFGIALFAGNLLLEVMNGNNRFGIAGRLLLRSLTECRITLSYLAAKNEDQLWLRYRNYGVGQAKLALLKLNELESRPNFLSEESLQLIANEDASEEFVTVDLGHWCNADLRKMAETAGVKYEYDAYYGWSSTFVHGGWAAVRDVSLAICMNPLHRLHRVPRGIQRPLEDVLEDTIGLFNRICAQVDEFYAGRSDELVVSLLSELGVVDINEDGLTTEGIK